MSSRRNARAASPVLGLSAALALLNGACSTPDALDPAMEVPTMAAVVPTTGLVGEWKLDETSGTNANDTKNNFDATVQGSAAFVAGKIDNGLNLNNGTSGIGGKYVQMPSNATLDNVQEGNYTISAWFYAYNTPPNAGSNNAFWGVVTKYGQHMGIAYNSANRFVARHYLTGNVLITNNSDDTFGLNAWHHVASVVNKGAGTVKIYVNGELQGTETFTANTAAREYGTTPFRIGRAETQWAADGKADQVRIYDVALSDQQITDLFEETAGSSFRFPVAMTKGQQIELLGMDHTPDGVMSAQSAVNIQKFLDTARAREVRVILRVTPANPNLENGSGGLSVSAWKSAFDDVASVNANSYLSDGTLIAHYAIDEPFADFTGMNGAILDSLCQYQKSKANWSNVPCFVRDVNTRLYTNRPGGNPYQYVDAGWASMADHHYMPPNTYDGDIGAYFRDNIAKGALAGLSLMYGFNLLNGGREDLPNCESPDQPQNCAMRPSEIEAMADTLAAIGDDQGCGVSGWWIDSNAGPGRNYFFDQDIQDALEYLNQTVGGLRPKDC
jgi:hypothetical protein